MNTKIKTIAGGLVVFALGFAAGEIIEIPADSSNGRGDISKVNKYYKASVSPEMSAFQEKLLNDSTEMAQANVSIALLTSRMTEFSKLVDVAEDATAGKKEFEGQLAELKSIQKISDNAAASGQAVGESFSSVMAGQKDASAASYEQNSQNFTVAYLMVSRQISVAKEFVATADNYLAKNGVENNKNLALARDLWAQYCAGESVLSGNKSELAYWSKKENILKGDDLASTYNAVADSTLQLAVVMDHLCGLASSVCPNPDLLAMAKNSVQSHGEIIVIGGDVVQTRFLDDLVLKKDITTVIFNKDLSPVVFSKEITTNVVGNKEIANNVNSKEITTNVVGNKEIENMVKSGGFSVVVVSGRNVNVDINSKDQSVDVVKSLETNQFVAGKAFEFEQVFSNFVPGVEYIKEDVVLSQDETKVITEKKQKRY